MSAEELLAKAEPIISRACGRLHARFKAHRVGAPHGFIAMDFGEAMRNSTTLFGQPERSLAVHGWHCIHLPIALEIGLGPWEDQIEFTELLVRGEQGHKVRVRVIAEFLEGVDLSPEFRLVPRQEAFDREAALRNLTRLN